MSTSRCQDFDAKIRGVPYNPLDDSDLVTSHSSLLYLEGIKYTDTCLSKNRCSFNVLPTTVAPRP